MAEFTPVISDDEKFQPVDGSYEEAVLKSQHNIKTELDTLNKNEVIGLLTELIKQQKLTNQYLSVMLGAELT